MVENILTTASLEKNESVFDKRNIDVNKLDLLRNKELFKMEKYD
jgi:hypothetical protein